MGARLLLVPEFAPVVPGSFEAWSRLCGETVSASRTTSTERVRVGGRTIHLKRTRLPLPVALRACLRNTLLGPSRAAREFRMLAAFRDRAGPGAAPAPVALGERRSLGLLRESFLATLTAPGAASLEEAPPSTRAQGEALGRFLGGLRAAGLVHGSLWSRNVLAGRDGGHLVVDLDRARILVPGETAALDAAWARDLARLAVSLPGLRPAVSVAILRAFLAEGTSRIVRRAWVAAIERRRDEAAGRLARRHRER